MAVPVTITLKMTKPVTMTVKVTVTVALAVAVTMTEAVTVTVAVTANVTGTGTVTGIDKANQTELNPISSSVYPLPNRVNPEIVERFAATKHC